jgi:magnesium transporter
MRLAQLISPELSTLLRDHPEEVRELLDEIHPEDVADLVGELEDDRGVALLQQLPTNYAAQVFERLDEDRQAQLMTLMGVDSAARLIVEMDADERADLYSQLPPDVGETLLETIERVDPEIAEDVEELARWPDTSAGGLMTTDYISLAPRLTIGDAINVLRRRAGDAETIDTIFALDGSEALVGVLPIRQMLLAEPGERIDEVMTRNIIAVPPEMDQEDVARKLAKYDFNSIPVVDADGKMLGVITSDDILDVLTEEQSEDVQKMAAVEPIGSEYFDTSIWIFLRKRAPWLLVLFFGGFFSASAMKAYDHVLAVITHLSFYVPLLVSAGGNSGAQSSSLVIRGLAIGEIQSGDWLKVLVRELTQGITLGVLLAVFGFGRAMLVGDGPLFATLIATTIVGLVVMGCVIGGMLPMLLHRIGVDPATSSTPFIATLIDALGILLYLSLAQFLFSEVLAAAPSPG